ncbi:hypothetical protein VPHF86_0269 [Vibrio phage F86]
MKTLINNKTVKITDSGNFNKLVRVWFDKDGVEIVGLSLDEDDIVNIKEYKNLTVPGGVHTLIAKAVEGTVYTSTVLGRLIFNRKDASYKMKEDRHRIQFTENLK